MKLTHDIQAEGFKSNKEESDEHFCLQYSQFSVDDWGCHYFQLINVILDDFLCELNISFPRRKTSVTDDFLFRVVVQTGKFCAKIDRNCVRHIAASCHRCCRQANRKSIAVGRLMLCRPAQQTTTCSHCS